MNENLTIRIRKIATVLAIIGIALCAILFLPFVQEAVIALMERFISHRELGNPAGWHQKILKNALSGIIILGMALLVLHSQFITLSVDRKTTRRIYALLEIALPALFVVLVIVLAASSRAIWVDEAFSLGTIQRPLDMLIATQKVSVHPPLYYLILKLVSLVFGEGIFVMKMVSIVPMAAALVIVTLFLKKEYSDRAVVLFQLCFLTSQAVVHYSIEIRMYGWAFLFVTLTAIAAWYIVSTGKARWWLVFLLCAEGSAYTHYYAALAAAIGYLLLLGYVIKCNRRQLRSALLTAGGGILLYLPWLFTAFTAFSQVSADFFTEPVTFRTLIVYIRFIFSTGSAFFSLVFLLIYVVIFCVFVKNKKTRKEWFAFACLCCFFAVAVTGILASLAAGHSLMIDRYLFPALGMVWLFFAVICGAVFSRRIFLSICVFLFALGTANVTITFFTEREENRDFMAFYEYLSENIAPEDIFIFPPGDAGNRVYHEREISAYLFPGHLQIAEFPSAFPKEYLERFDRTALSYSALSGNNIIAGRSAWIITPETEEGGDDPSLFFALQNHNVQFCGTFGWEAYRFNLYHTGRPADIINGLNERR